jgi:hypothetical protein
VGGRQAAAPGSGLAQSLDQDSLPGGELNNRLGLVSEELVDCRAGTQTTQ